MKELKNWYIKVKFVLSLGIFMAVYISLFNVFTSCTKPDLKDNNEHLQGADKTSPAIVSVSPGNNTSGVSTTATVIVTFSEAINPVTITSTSFTVKQGSAYLIGTVMYTGTVATFTPTTGFAPGTEYTGIITTAAKDLAGNALEANYTWSFTTSAVADATAPTVLSVTPAVSATSVALNIKPAITFSEAMNTGTLTASSITLKQGSTAVTGTVTYTGTVATFSPAAVLAPNTVYTGTITTAVKDVAGNALATNCTWNFTTSALADVTAPTVISVTPAVNATSIAVSAKPAVTFSEAINPSTVTSSTFVLKNGSTVVTGAIVTSGATATFTPSSALTGNTVYTVTIETGVKDVAGNSMASNYSWSFTTVATAPAGISFATQVVPVLNLCNTCHKHNWTVSSNPATFHTNLVNGGYVSTTTPNSGKIYSKVSGGHPSGSTVTAAQKTMILKWISEGSKNN